MVVAEILGGLIGFIAFLMCLAPVAGYARQRVAKYETERARTGAGGVPLAAKGDSTQIAAATAADIRLPPIPLEETASYYVRKLLTHSGLLGALFFVPLVIFFPLNVMILAENWSVLLDRAGTPLGTLGFRGWQFELTDMHFYGVAIAIATVLLAAAYAAECHERSVRLRWFALLAWLAPVVAFETGLAAERGLHVNNSSIGPEAMAAWSALQGWVTASVEIASGYYAIHRFVLVLIQLVSWAIIAPFRWAFRALPARRRRPHPAVKALVRDDQRPSLVTRILAYLDEGMFDPLRDLDRSVAGVLAWATSRRKAVSHVS